MANKNTLSYSRNEMADYTNLQVKKFTDNLKKVCDKYNINISAFKTDPNNDKTDYCFPPQIAEFLAILVKNDDKHPYFRKNTDLSKITASSIRKYITAVLIDIESTDTTIKNRLYSADALATSLEIDNWIKPFTRELTHFIVLNITKYGNIGQAIKHYTEKLNQMNYYLHRSEFIQPVSYVNHSDLDNIENISLDNLIATIIKYEMSTLSTPIVEVEDLYKISKKCNYKSKEELSALSKKEQRSLYIRLCLGSKLLQNKIDNNTLIYKKKIEDAENWLPIDEKISEGCFDSIEEHKKYLLNEIQTHKEKIEILERELKTIEETGKPSKIYFYENRQEFLSDCNENFVTRCLVNDYEYEDLYKVVDRFLGQTLLQFL